MRVINVRNVHQALPEALYELGVVGVSGHSRNGEVVAFPTPVTTVYSRPTERVVFWPQRDANPFFHLMESLWMLAGRNDLKFIKPFAKNIANYSDDGKTLHGAYGYRWRHLCEEDVDQLPQLILLLRTNPNTRRAVLQMWDGAIDLYSTEDDTPKDLPCNTHIYFHQQDHYLNMTVCCRSNDIVWGAYGANAVHFSMLLEYMAGMTKFEVGKLYQISNNLHAYKTTLEPVKCLSGKALDPFTVNRDCPYALGWVAPYPLVRYSDSWDRDLSLFLEDPASNGFDNPFFHKVAKPVYWSHVAYRDKKAPDRFAKAKDIISQCAASDWRLACQEWLARRELKANV